MKGVYLECQTEVVLEDAMISFGSLFLSSSYVAAAVEMTTEELVVVNWFTQKQSTNKCSASFLTLIYALLK